MKIGIVSNSKTCLPLLHYLNNNKAGVMLYLGKSAQAYIGLDIAAFCSARQIAVHAEEDKNELYRWLQLHNLDVVFVSGYSYKIDVAQLKEVPGGIYNIHFGVLPQYRGPSPVFWQLKNGEPQIGLTIHEMTNKLDGGAIVWEQAIRNEEHHTYNYINQLFGELQVRGAAEILIKLSKELQPEKRAQNESQSNYYNKPQLADVVVNWGKMEVQEVINLIKACNSWNNGASTQISGYELKILDAEIGIEQCKSDVPGTIMVTNNSFSIACIKGQVLKVNFFNINSTCIPARHAGFYGLKTGQILVSK